MAGDSLARGAKSAMFSVGGRAKTDLSYDLALLTKSEFLAKHPEMTEARYDELLAEYERGQA